MNKQTKVNILEKVIANLFFYLTIFSIYSKCYSQSVINLKREGGVSMIPCRINSLPLNFVFDTGASEVFISLTEARFMLKNGYLQPTDLIGVENYSNANGEIFEGVTINLKSIEIGDIILSDVKASISNSLNAPLLLGQSAILKLGVIQLDLANDQLVILGKSNGKSNVGNTKSKTLNESNIKIGAHMLGGIVAYIFKPEDDGFIYGEQHGLILSDKIVEPKGIASWSNLKNTTNTYFDFGKGESNTTEIILNDTNRNIAARICGEYFIGKYNDWYLPSFFEWSAIADNSIQILGIEQGCYWSSSEFQGDEAIAVCFTESFTWEHVEKTNLFKVRAIRRF